VLVILVPVGVPGFTLTVNTMERRALHLSMYLKDD
jgi:hypothetical protein